MSIFQSTLPKEWLWACVGDFYAVTKKPRSLNLSVFEKIPFSPMDCIPQGGQFDLRYTHKPAEEIKSGTYFEHGDVLVGKITPCFENGKQALAIHFPAPFGYATTEVIPLHPKDTYQDRRVLFYYLLHPDVRSHITEKMEGATGRQRVPENVLLELSFPKIPFAEQEKIGAILLTVQQAIQCEAAGFDNAQDLKCAAMREVFTRGLRGEAQKKTEIGLVPESWEVSTIGKHFSLSSGGTPSRNNQNYWESGSIPWVKTTEINYTKILNTEELITPLGLQESAAKLLPEGTLLMAMYGQGVTRGKVGILGIAATCNQACAAINTKTGDILTEYLFYFLTYQYDNIRQMAHGGQQQNLNLEIVRSLFIGFPHDQEEQTQIVTLLSAIDDKITLHKRKKAALEALFTSLLHQLMTGKIRVDDLDLSALSQPQTEAT